MIDATTPRRPRRRLIVAVLLTLVWLVGVTMLDWDRRNAIARDARETDIEYCHALRDLDASDIPAVHQFCDTIWTRNSGDAALPAALATAILPAGILWGFGWLARRRAAGKES
jgi:hypothetical protein